jgi:hypothetical protein
MPRSDTELSRQLSAGKPSRHLFSGVPGRELECSCSVAAAAAEGPSVFEIELLEYSHGGLVTHRGIHV